jgi:MFS family permease
LYPGKLATAISMCLRFYLNAGRQGTARQWSTSRSLESLQVYLTLVRLPGARRALIPALVARSTFATAGLTILLLVHSRTGSFSRAGLAVALYAIGATLSTPIMGRATDRYGPLLILMPLALAYPVVLLSMLFVRNGLVMLSLAVMAGATQPPAGAAMRALWPHLTTDQFLVAKAYNFEAVLVETAFVLGPLLVGLFVTIFGPHFVVVLPATTMGLGTLAFVSAPVVRGLRGSRAGKHVRRPISSSGVRSLLIIQMLTAVAFGSLQLAVTAFCVARGHAGLSGLMLACWAAGSLFGGLLYGSRRWHTEESRRFLRLMICLPVTLIPLYFATNIAELALFLAVTGATVAPTYTEQFALVARHSPPGTATEAFAWVSATITAGTAIGSAIAGSLEARSGVRAVFLLTMVAAFTALFVAFQSRRDLAAKKTE